MAATPKTGVIEFKGKSGQRYVYTIYNPDVAADFLNWDRMKTAGTGSVDFITAPEDMVITDISVVTGIVDTTALLLFLDDGAIAGKLVSWANVVNTLQARSFPNIGVKAGRKVQFQCVA